MDVGGIRGGGGQYAKRGETDDIDGAAKRGECAEKVGRTMVSDREQKDTVIEAPLKMGKGTIANEEDVQINLDHHPKVNFRRKAFWLYGKYLASVFIISVISIVLAFFLIISGKLPLDNTFLDSEQGFKVVYTMILGIPLVFLVRIGMKELIRFKKSGSVKILIDFLLSLGFIFFFAFMVSVFIIPVNIMMDYIFPLMSTICMIPFMDIFILCGIAYTLWMYSKGSLLGLYPQAIASAEQEIEEYLDGYSDRPFESERSVINTNTFGGYARFLMRYLIIHDYFIKEDVIILQFPPPIRTVFSRKKRSSWMKVRMDGRTSIYISPKDYGFLGVPISYHLLCEKTLNRIWTGYDLFLAGEKDKALKVFNVDKTIKSRRSYDRRMGGER